MFLFSLNCIQVLNENAFKLSVVTFSVRLLSSLLSFLLSKAVSKEVCFGFTMAFRLILGHAHVLRKTSICFSKLLEAKPTYLTFTYTFPSLRIQILQRQLSQYSPEKRQSVTAIANFSQFDTPRIFALFTLKLVRSGKSLGGDEVEALWVAQLLFDLQCCRCLFCHL